MDELLLFLFAMFSSLFILQVFCEIKEIFVVIFLTLVKGKREQNILK